MMPSIDSLNVKELRSVVKRVNARIEMLLPFEKANSLKVGSIIKIGKNNRVKTTAENHWGEYPLDFKFIRTDPDLNTYMIVRGPLGMKGIKPRTVSVSKAILHKIVKKA